MAFYELFSGDILVWSTILIDEQVNDYFYPNLSIIELRGVDFHYFCFVKWEKHINEDMDISASSYQ